MSQSKQQSTPNHGPARPAPKNDDVGKNKQKAEEQEVAGRHKNQGRDEHAGHKVTK